MIKIVKYSNRKYYFQALKSYVSLLELSKILKYDNIQVIDFDSQKDITNNTLKMIITKLPLENKQLIGVINGL